MIDVYCDACGYLGVVPRQDPQGHALTEILRHHAAFFHGGAAFGYTLVWDNLRERKGTWSVAARPST